jgi:hypothetical protein
MLVARIDQAPLAFPQPALSRARSTVRGPSFAEVVRGGLGVVLGGASLAAGFVGAPLLSNAVRAGSTASATVGSSGGDGDMMQQMKELQRESRDMNLELLALQEQVQQENRRFSTASNVLKARHETAKAAIGNIRP